MRIIKWLLLLCCSFSLGSLQAQTKLSGKVISQQTGLPVDGATVNIKNTNISTATAPDGSFTLNGSSKATLVISFVGHRTIEISASELSQSIQLVPGDNALSEIVVVGYGQSSKRELTSSIVQVKGSDVANTPVPNFTQALQGRAAGVFVESNNGKVGEGIKVRIRGQGSVNASNDPLYVVDGIPISTGGLSGNALADLNFNDVETFDILKDAAATAIYGSRAANGVILITTKKGKSGKPKFTVGTQFGTNQPTNKREFLNSGEFVELLREGAVNAGKYHFNRAGNPRGFATEQAAVDNMITFVEGRFTRYSGFSDWRKLETNTNWEDEAFQDAKISAIDVSASGGNDKTRFYLSGAYTNQDGILFGNSFDRISARMNLDQELTSRLKVGVNMSLARTNTTRVADDNEFYTPMQIVALAPITPIRDRNGKLYNTPTTTYYNPLLELEGSEYKSYSFRNIGSAFAQFNFMPNLYFRSEFGIDIQHQNDERFHGSTTLLGRSTNGFGSSRWFKNERFTTNNFINYNVALNEVHDLEATAGFSFEKATARSTSTTGEQFPGDDLRGLVNAAKITGGSSARSEFGLASYFGRLSYKFKDKYLLGVTGRYDGSSVFGKNERYGFFPAVSAGWVVSKEAFLNNSKAISFLKLRASYGQLGNALGFGNYTAQPAYVAGRYAGQAVLVPGRLGNFDLTWETSNQLDIGLEFGILKDRITGEIDYYDKKSAGSGKGFIFNLPVPATSGYTSYIANVGEIQNKGIEFSLNTSNINNKNFKWTTSFNISRNSNKVLKIDGQQDTLSFNDGRYMNALMVGQPIGVHYGPRFAGVDVQNGDGLYFKQDGKSTTNNYNDAGNFVVGDPNPKWFGGLGNNFSYKGIELNVLFQGVFDYDIVNGAAGFMSASADWFDNQTRDQLNRWRKPGDVTNVPQARLNRFGDFASPSVSTQHMQSGSYVRLKNITLAYSIPTKLLNRAKIGSARVYVTAINLATFTKYTGWDPEVNTDYRASNINQGGDFYAAPQIKSIVFGLNLGF